MDRLYDAVANFPLLIEAFLPLVVLSALAVALELRIPWRREDKADGLRWLQAGVLLMIGVLATRLILPIGAFAIGLYAEAAGIGLLNRIGLPVWAGFALGLLALDFGEYARHALLHRFGALWRLHRVHHSDEHLDASSALRFHPLEIMSEAAVQAGIILALGIPAYAVLVFLSVSLVFNVWEHANIRTPRMVRRLEPVFITPDLHRLHHSDLPRDRGVNFGAVLSVWDRAFGTLRRSDARTAQVRFGLGPDNALRFDTLGALLGDPLRAETSKPGASTEESF
ncbi:MAG: sterol desaturase/sphingolipid hydroxylase (fatty acid hydroxylase superfamily) [Paracoccaceae bacterium]|jgi:sterol desaturase/sphingolipid hydroxylase (fatty acid hydroxylase superfamily)